MGMILTRYRPWPWHNHGRTKIFWTTLGRNGWLSERDRLGRFFSKERRGLSLLVPRRARRLATAEIPPNKRSFGMIAIRYPSSTNDLPRRHETGASVTTP